MSKLDVQAELKKPNNKSPLLRAVEGGDLECVKLMVTAGYPVNALAIPTGKINENNNKQTNAQTRILFDGGAKCN